MNNLPFDFLQLPTGEPTEKSLKEMESFQQDCALRRDTNSFYLMFDLRPPPKTSWCHNLKLHLGETSLSQEEFYKRIHPAWLPLHYGFAQAAYMVHAHYKTVEEKEHSIYTVNIPLLRADGTYNWYSQVSFPVTYDEEGTLVHHLNHYYRICPYDNLVPSKPLVQIKGVPQKRFDSIFEATASTYLASNLREVLSKTNYRVLITYRRLCVFKDGQWKAPLKSLVREELSMSASAINKANVRIKKSVKKDFPTSITHDVASLAAFLNEMCGLPKKEDGGL